MEATNNAIVFALFNRINPASIDEYLNNGGFEAWRKALEMQPEEIIRQVELSKLRGRGGAGFPTYLKMKLTYEYRKKAGLSYVICNADEGEPGTFKDRYIMEFVPFLCLEGLAIAAYAVRANKAFIYIRGEYTQSIKMIDNAIKQMYAKGLLGVNILGKGYDLEIEMFIGGGSYLCGEELTLIESLEGKRGYPRIKPPFPAEKGLWNKPTLVNNVETLSNLPYILLHGGEKYSQIGTEESKGTKIFCLSGKVKNPGPYELPFGTTLRDLIFKYGQGMREGFSFKGALLGGAAGTFVDESMLDVPLAYETLRQNQATLGSGAVIVIDDKTDLKVFLTSILRFFKHESCGKCVPCRVGTTLLYETIIKDKLNELDLNFMLEQSQYMAKFSLCPLGQSLILPTKSFIKYFKNTIL